MNSYSRIKKVLDFYKIKSSMPIVINNRLYVCFHFKKINYKIAADISMSRYGLFEDTRGGLKLTHIMSSSLTSFLGNLGCFLKERCNNG